MKKVFLFLIILLGLFSCQKNPDNEEIISKINNHIINNTPQEVFPKDITPEDSRQCIESHLDYSFLENTCIGAKEYFNDPKRFLYKSLNKSDEQLDDEVHSFSGFREAIRKKLPAELGEQFLILYQNFEKEITNKNPKEIEKIAQKYQDLLDRILLETKNTPEYWMKREIKNLIEGTRIQKTACTGKYCDITKILSTTNNSTDKYGQYYRDVYSLQLKNDTKLVWESYGMATFGCYYGKTWLERNGEQKIIIDEVPLAERQHFCTVRIEPRDEENFTLLTCMENGGGSGECQGYALNYNISTGKLSLLGPWYFVPEAPFSIESLKHYAKLDEQQREEYTKETIASLSDLKDDNKATYQNEKEYIEDAFSRHQNLSKYLKEAHKIDIGSFPYEELRKFFDIK